MKKIKKQLFIIIFSFLCLFYNTSTVFAKDYYIREIPEDQIEDAEYQFYVSSGLMFQDYDGSFKGGSYKDVFNYLKDRFRFDTLPKGTWNEYDRTGDTYDIFIFFHDVTSLDYGSLSVLKYAIKKTLLYTDEQTAILKPFQDISIRGGVVGICIFFVLSISRLTEENKLNRKNVLINIAYTLAALFLLSNIQNVSTVYFGINNFITERVSDITDGSVVANGKVYMTIDYVKQAAKNADGFTFTESQQNSRIMMKTIIFSFFVRTISNVAPMFIIRSTQIIFFLTLILLPVLIMDLPYNRLKGMGGKALLTLLSYCCLPAFYMLTYTIVASLQNISNTTEKDTVFIMSLVLPLTVIPVMIETKYLVKEVVNTLFANYSK